MWQYMILCGVGAKPVAHLMQYHLLQWGVAQIKWLMNSNMSYIIYIKRHTEEQQLRFK